MTKQQTTPPSTWIEGHDIYWHCAHGFHAWVPWLEIRLDDGTVRSYQTWCAREGCRHVEQYDR